MANKLPKKVSKNLEGTGPLEHLVVKQNNLLEASSPLSLDEHRLIISAIAKVDPRKKLPSKQVNITALEYAESWGLDPKTAYQQLKRAAESLYHQSIVFDRHNATEEFRWIQRKTIYKRGAGQVTITFTDDVLPYITELHRNFTSYQQRNVRHLRSAHSVRLYELLVRFSDQGHRRFAELDDFRFSMDIAGKYADYKNLRKRVIDPAVAELCAHTDLDVAYLPIKRGRRITGLEFSMVRKSQPDLFAVEGES
ncbi:replication initiation protein (plasmid) [Microbulbifer sp. TRSA001]|uniref:replication initiation protein n=1 Tax=Microbulbifer sp. TRSA001 TaxID=3243381 RepID=UPI004039A301